MSNEADGKQSHLIQRRHFLGAMGAGAVAASATSAAFVRTARANDKDRDKDRVVNRADRFGRMFPNLPPFFGNLNLDDVNFAMREIGALNGIMDARDNLGGDPGVPRGGEQAAINLIAIPALSVNNPNNPGMTAGSTFMGQFLDHDMTFDLSTALGVEAVPEQSPNERTPAFDLDTVYGGGPRVSPHLYDVDNRGRVLPTLRIESGGLAEDLPRNLDGTAIIGDPRNDENTMIAGLQAAFIMFHNAAVDLVRSEGLGFNNGRSSRHGSRDNDDDVFAAANELTRWHYQWVLLNEILVQFIGAPAVFDILNNGRKFFRPKGPFIPVEFQIGYRFGHTLIRPSYRANMTGDNPLSPAGAQFFGMIFDPSGEGQLDPVDLRGGARARRRFIGWQTFFNFGPAFTDPGNAASAAVRPNKLIDTNLSTPLFLLPVQTIAGGVGPGDPISLASRNMLRTVTWSLPSGQAIARAIGAPALTRANDPVLAELDHLFGLNLGNSTPLWFYILREGAVMGSGGLHLGPVGGRIVGEVFVALLQLDPNSFLNARREWTPTLAQRSGFVTGDFKMVDILTFAGVGPKAPSFDREFQS